ncbi:MAG: hypothetical protein QM803_04740 [Rhodocyclaceae bacterium]
MPEYEDYEGTAGKIELEIERKLMILGIDWHDEGQMRDLARRALEFNAAKGFPKVMPGDGQTLAKIELFGLVGLMLRNMEESASAGREVHGREAWKAVARALWAEKEAQGK